MIHFHRGEEKRSRRMKGYTALLLAEVMELKRENLSFSRNAG